jgi:predicted Zn finger-like uncharacterized protein
MSLLTQCPACQTYYRVVPDQLRISDGWVKCGKCSDIFDASAHLIEVDFTSGTTDFEPQADVESEDTAVTPQDDLPAPALNLPEKSPKHILLPQTDLLAQSVQTGRDASEVFGTVDTGDVVERIEPVWVAQDVEADSTPDAVPQLVFPEVEPAPVPDIFEEPQPVRWDDAATSTSTLVAMPLEQVAQAFDEPVTFLRDVPPPSAWQKPLIQSTLVLVAAGLLVLLAGQWVYRERDRLAASHTDLKPALLTVCAWLNCEVRPVRQIDALLIDSVAFNKLDNETYKLSFLVKNTSDLPLAYPAVELVLTDAEDQPAYRRVLSSSELGSNAAELAAGSDWAVTVPLRIDVPMATQRVLGYRLLVFYP